MVRSLCKEVSPEWDGKILRFLKADEMPIQGLEETGPGGSRD